MRAILTALLLVSLMISPLAAEELSGTLLQIQKSGKMRIGYRVSHPPMSFLDKDGTPVGYSIDLCLQIAAAVEDEIDRSIAIEYIPVAAEDRFDALPENKIDILCGATTRTLSRGKTVDFTQLTFVTGASFMTLRGKKIQNNFAGKKIGVVQNTTTAESLQELLKETKTAAEVVLFATTAEGVEALDKEKVDAFAADQIVLIGLLLTAKEPNSYTVLPDLFSYEPFALAVRRNDSDFRLVADSVISRLFRTRKIDAIYDKWIGKISKQKTSGFAALSILNSIPE